jgi:hypothetical protein
MIYIIRDGGGAAAAKKVLVGFTCWHLIGCEVEESTGLCGPAAAARAMRYPYLLNAPVRVAICSAAECRIRGILVWLWQQGGPGIPR